MYNRCMDSRSNNLNENILIMRSADLIKDSINIRNKII